MLIRKGNVELDINEQFLQQYLNQGYDVIDSYGNVIRKGIPNDVTSLKAALKDANNNIKNLNNRLSSLQDKINELESQLKTAKKKPTTKNIK